MQVFFEEAFDWFENDETSRVFQIIPDVFEDERGYFMEVFKQYPYQEKEELPLWIKNSKWIKQINRSSSQAGVIRGCHAQKGKFCQGKLVEAINEKIYDIITDARPNSKSFGTSTIVFLDPKKHNKLWVPRGFLHAFVVPLSNNSNAIFEYYCDNVYDKSSEVGVAPSTLLPKLIENFKKLIGEENNEYTDLFNTFTSDKPGIYSEKDQKAEDYVSFMNRIMNDYNKTKKVWYK